MAKTKKYLDYAGLKTYHEKAKSEYDGKYALKGEAGNVDLSNYITRDEIIETSSGEKLNIIDSIQFAYDDASDYYSKFYVSDDSGDDATPIINKVIALWNFYNDNKDKNYALKSEVVDLDTLKQVVAEAPHIKKEKVETLPPEADGVENVLYLVPRSNTEDGDYFDQYLLIDGKWDPIGSTKTNLANYYTKDEAQAAIDEAMAGVDIESISNDDIDLLFKSLPEGFVPYPANGLYPSPDNFLRVWAGEELIAEKESPEYIWREEYSNKGITRVEMPNSVIRAQANAFSRNYLKSVTTPDGFTIIGESIFAYNNLTSITIPDSVTHINTSAFYGNQLTSVIIPDSVTNIGTSAFKGNPIETVYISKGTEFKDNSFPEGAEIIYRD